MIFVYAFAAAWILVSSIWFAFCLLDGFRTWIDFRIWRSTVLQCQRAAMLLLDVLVQEINHERERVCACRRERHVGPHVDKPESQDSYGSDRYGDSAR